FSVLGAAKIVGYNIVDEVKEHAGKKKRMVVFKELPAKRLRSDAAAASKVVPSTSGKSPTALKKLELQSRPPDDEVAPPRIEDIVAASARGTVKTSTADNIYVPEEGVTNGARVDNLTFYRNLLDHITPPAYWAMLRNLSPAAFLDAFNIKSAQHTCMVSELRLRLERAEHEAVEAVSLHGRVSEMKAGAVISKEVETLGKQNAELLSKVFAIESEREELNRHVIKLGDDCERLRKEVVGEAKLREEFKSFQDVEACRFEQKSAELDSRIADVRRDMDNDLYPHMFTTIDERRWILSHGVRLTVMKCAQSDECRSALGKVISLAVDQGIQEGLEAGIEHGKSIRSLAQVEAYNPGVKDDFVSAITDFENLSFALLDELESLKDSPLASVTVPIYSESGSVSSEILLSEVVPIARASVERRGLCLPPLGGTSSSAPQPLVVHAHDDLFDTSVLDGAGGA
nr:hypothetical protein [Tanacetum cinerariifolium]